MVDADPEEPPDIADELAAAAEEILADDAGDDDDDAVTLDDDRDVGDLYGVRTPHASDTELAAPEDRDAFAGADGGETWIEALAERAAEGGPAAEEEVAIVDESDGHHPTETRDRPVADKGSGGPGGR